MKAEFLELLARNCNADGVANRVAQADALSREVATFLNGVDPAIRRTALDLMMAEISSRMTNPESTQGKPSPEVIAWARESFDKEEFLAELRQVEQTGGSELKEFLHELRTGEPNHG